jgi:hypothetical protein
MAVFLSIWFLSAFFVAFVFGTARTIGFWYCLLFCLVLSPMVGFIISLFYETKTKANDRKKMLELQQQNNELLKQMAQKQS